jgi:protein transport protein SEC24
VISRAVATLHSYRRYCATSSSSVQLILPEALKLLPLYSLGLCKSGGLRWDVRPDERAAWLAAAMSATCAALTPMLYGRLVPVHQMLQQRQSSGGAEGELGWLPDGSLLSSEVFEAGGLYLLENGREALVYVDKAAPPAVWQEVAGVDSAEELARAGGAVQVVARDAPLSRMLQSLLVRVRQQRCAYMRLRLVRKGEASEAAFLHGLVEDRGSGGMSYVEHLCHVHRLIQGKMG